MLIGWLRSVNRGAALFAVEMHEVLELSILSLLHLSLPHRQLVEPSLLRVYWLCSCDDARVLGNRWSLNLYVGHRVSISLNADVVGCVQLFFGHAVPVLVH